MKGLTRAAAASWLLVAACSGGAELEPAAPAADSRAELAAEEPVEETAPPSQEERAPASLRGRVVDRATGVGVAQLWVELTGEGHIASLRTDAEGYFQLGTPVPAGRVRARVSLSPSGERVPSRPSRFEHDPALGAQEVHALRVEMGPSIALRFGEAAGVAPERFEARLVERGPGGEDREWSWRRLVAGELPMLRYTSVEFPPSPAFHARVELRLVAGDWFGRAPVRSTSSVEVQEVPVRLVQYAAFGGVVVDEEGVAVPEALVLLRQEAGDALPAYARGWRRARAGVGGAFLFAQELEPGRYHVRVLAEGRSPIDFDLKIEEGGLSGYEIRIPALAAEAALTGVVRALRPGGQPAVVLSLWSEDRSVERVLHALQKPSALERDALGVSEEGDLYFSFTQLPAGSYELAAFALDGRSYSLEPVAFDLPGEPIELEPVPVSSTKLVAFDVEPAGEGPSLESYEVVFRSRDWWNPEGHRLAPGSPLAALPRESSVTWMLGAPGFRPVYGSRASFEPGVGPDAPDRASVALHPGWGVELWLKEAGPRGVPEASNTFDEMAIVRARRGLAGVRVLADGVQVGVSDERGVVRLTLAQEPELLEFEVAGFAPLESESYARGRLFGAALSRVVWFEPR